MISNIQEKHDGSYIIEYNGSPYHADKSATPDVFEQVVNEVRSGASVARYEEPTLPEDNEETKADIEREWAMSELARSDRALTPDFPVSSPDREKIMAYRAQLRNPLRSNHKDFPDPAWRPQWPEGVKRPAV